MSFSEINNHKGENNSNFDIDKRAELPKAQDTKDKANFSETNNQNGENNSSFDIDKRAELPKAQDTKDKENKQADVDNEEKNRDLDTIAEKIGTAEGISEYFEKYPDKLADVKKYMDIINDPNATATEKRQAENKLNGIVSSIKGGILESAVKDVLKDSGLNVEDKQRVVEGEKGKTLPDVIAKNETDKPIEVIGITIEPGGTITIECKCGGQAYLNDQLDKHIPKQLAGHEGTSVLITTSDIKDVSQDKVKEVCNEHNTKQITVDVRAAEVTDAIKKEAVQR